MSFERFVVQFNQLLDRAHRENWLYKSGCDISDLNETLSDSQKNYRARVQFLRFFADLFSPFRMYDDDAAMGIKSYTLNKSAVFEDHNENKYGVNDWRCLRAIVCIGNMVLSNRGRDIELSHKYQNADWAKALANLPDQTTKINTPIQKLYFVGLLYESVKSSAMDLKRFVSQLSEENRDQMTDQVDRLNEAINIFSSQLHKAQDVDFLYYWQLYKNAVNALRALLDIYKLHSVLTGNELQMYQRVFLPTYNFLSEKVEQDNVNPLSYYQYFKTGEQRYICLPGLDVLLNPASSYGLAKGSVFSGVTMGGLFTSGFHIKTNTFETALVRFADDLYQHVWQRLSLSANQLVEGPPPAYTISG